MTTAIPQPFRLPGVQNQKKQIPLLNYTKTHLAVETYIKSWNAKHPDKKEQIRQSMKETITRILIELKKAALRKGRINIIRVTCNYLSQACQCCVKTIYNHIIRLIDTDLIKSKAKSQLEKVKFDHAGNPVGATPCISLEINPEVVIFEGDEKGVIHILLTTAVEKAVNEKISQKSTPAPIPLKTQIDDPLKIE